MFYLPNLSARFNRSVSWKTESESGLGQEEVEEEGPVTTEIPMRTSQQGPQGAHSGVWALGWEQNTTRRGPVCRHSFLLGGKASGFPRMRVIIITKQSKPSKLCSVPCLPELCYT